MQILRIDVVWFGMSEQSDTQARARGRQREMRVLRIAIVWFGMSQQPDGTASAWAGRAMRLVRVEKPWVGMPQQPDGESRVLGDRRRVFPLIHRKQS